MLFVDVFGKIQTAEPVSKIRWMSLAEEVGVLTFMLHFNLFDEYKVSVK